MRAAWTCVALAAATVACGADGGGPSEPSPVGALTPVAATDEWPSSTPESEGLDSGPLLDLVTRIHRRDYGAIHSLLVVRNGRSAGVRPALSRGSAAYPFDATRPAAL